MSASPQNPRDVERRALDLKKQYPTLSIHQRRVIASVQLWHEVTGDARYALVGFDGATRPVLSRPEYGEVRYWAVLRNGDPTDPAGVMSATTKRTVEDIVTQNIIEALEAGTVPWDKPWSVMPGFGAPGNVISKKPYRGINVLLTGLQPFIEPWWITKRQARAADLRIKDEEFRRSTPIILWKPSERRCAQDEPGAVWSDEAKSWVKRTITRRFYDVWNVEQLEQYEGDGSLAGLIPPPPPEPHVEDIERTALEVFDDYLHREGIGFGTGAMGASYNPRTDAIALPHMATFKHVPAYIHTALHEGIHSTGHEKRLNRPSVMAPEFGTEPYAAEELVAEVGSAMLCAHLGIDPDIQRSSAYIDNWLKALDDDRKLVINAAQAAQKAADLIMFEPDDEEVTS